MKILHGLKRKGHCIVMDNYFCSILLFQKLVQKWIYATNMVIFNRIGFPSHLKNTKAWKHYEHGHIKWTMHNRAIARNTCTISGQMLCVQCILYHKFWGIEAMEARILLKVDVTFLLIVVIFLEDEKILFNLKTILLICYTFRFQGL
jgi:hypothetical protein